MKSHQLLKFFLILNLLCFSSLLSATIKPSKPSETKLKDLSKREDKVKALLLAKYAKRYKSNKDLAVLKAETLQYKGLATPALIEVMKNSQYPEKNRWLATFMIGTIIGKKSAPFIAKFSEHPNWVMRLAALKTLLALSAHEFGYIYSKALKDKSLIVRTQALTNIREMGLKHYAPQVWSMLYDQKNYYVSKAKISKRSEIIGQIVRTIGHLKFEKAKEPLLKMIQKKKYNDIFEDLNYSLEKIVGSESPEGNKNVKRRYWSRVAINETKI